MMDCDVRPEDFCADWSDDVRMRALFGPLPSHAAQPEARAGRLRFWTDLIEAWAVRAGNRCLFTTGDLCRYLTRAGRLPQCLEEVVAAGRTAGLYAKPSAFIDQFAKEKIGPTTAGSWSSWLLGLGSGVVRTIGASVLGDGSVTAVSSDTEFVIISQVNKLEEDCLKLIDSSSALPLLETFNARYLREGDLLTCLSGASSHTATRNYMLILLCRTGRLARLTIGQTVVYKVERQRTGGVVMVDEVDRGILQLQASLELIAAQVAATEQQAANEAVAIKESLRAGSRLKARASLQRQKRAERRLAELLRQQENLEVVYEEILRAESSVQIVSAYESGLAAMKSLVQSPEAAEATMSELAELLEAADSLSNTLALPVGEDSDAAELEKQLATLLEKETRETKEKEESAILDQLEGLTVAEDDLMAGGDLEPVICVAAAVTRKPSSRTDQPKESQLPAL